MLGNRAKTQHYRVGGTRGGQGQFKWEDVKTDKDRESYLGNSVNAPAGRWQKGKDIFWYNKSNDQQKQALEEEKLRMREQDDDLLNEAVGIKPKKRKFVENSLDATEIKQLLQKGGVDRGSETAEPVKGLGSGAARHHDHIERLSSIEKEILKLKQGNDVNGTSSSSAHVIIPSASPEVISESKASSNDVESSSDSDSHREKKKHKSKHKKEKHKHKHKHSHKSSHRRDD